MTDADLAAIAGALEAERAHWAERLAALIDRKLDDAYAHVKLAVTETLKGTPDGRATIRRASKHPSYQAAVNRLWELWVKLAGPARYSLMGELRDARAAFYRTAFGLHTPHIPGSIRVAPDPSPTARNVDLVRGAAIHGHELSDEIGHLVHDALHRLTATVAIAGSRDADERQTADLIKAWHQKTRRSFELTVLSLLSDSVEHANAEAMADLVHPDFRAD